MARRTRINNASFWVLSGFLTELVLQLLGLNLPLWAILTVIGTGCGYFIHQTAIRINQVRAGQVPLASQPRLRSLRRQAGRHMAVAGALCAAALLSLTAAGSIVAFHRSTLFVCQVDVRSALAVIFDLAAAVLAVSSSVRLLGASSILRPFAIVCAMLVAVAAFGLASQNEWLTTGLVSGASTALAAGFGSRYFLIQVKRASQETIGSGRPGPPNETTDEAYMARVARRRDAATWATLPVALSVFAILFSTNDWTQLTLTAADWSPLPLRIVTAFATMVGAAILSLLVVLGYWAPRRDSEQGPSDAARLAAQVGLIGANVIEGFLVIALVAAFTIVLSLIAAVVPVSRMIMGIVALGGWIVIGLRAWSTSSIGGRPHGRH